MRKTCLIVLAFASVASQAMSLQISIGVRETDSTGDIGSNGGATGGIEWINLDGQVLSLDGGWQLFTFDFALDPVTPFAGATANGTLDVSRGVLEHIRVRSGGGVDVPVTVWVDDITSTDAAGNSITFGNFEGYSAGQKVMFQEPGYSGSTAGHLEPGSTTGVDTETAYSGSNSYRADFQFVDGADTRWMRWTTFGATHLPNPVIDLSPGSTLSFYMKGEAVPEPATMALLGLGAAALAVRKRKKKV